MPIDVERLNGTFVIQGPLFKGKLFSGRLEDGTEFHFICRDMEAVGSMLDALRWKAEVDPDMIRDAVVGSAAPEALRNLPEDDIPF